MILNDISTKSITAAWAALVQKCYKSKYLQCLSTVKKIILWKCAFVIRSDARNDFKDAIVDSLHSMECLNAILWSPNSSSFLSQVLKMICLPPLISSFMVCGKEAEFAFEKPGQSLWTPNGVNPCHSNGHFKLDWWKKPQTGSNFSLNGTLETVSISVHQNRYLRKLPLFHSQPYHVI